MRNFYLEPVVGVGDFVHWEANHARLLNLFTTSMAKPPLGEDEQDILMTQPLGDLLYRFAVGVPESVAGGEVDGEGRRVRLIQISVDGKIF